MSYMDGLGEVRSPQNMEQKHPKFTVPPLWSSPTTPQTCPQTPSGFAGKGGQARLEGLQSQELVELDHPMLGVRNSPSVARRQPKQLPVSPYVFFFKCPFIGLLVWDSHGRTILNFMIEPSPWTHHVCIRPPLASRRSGKRLALHR